MAKILLVEDDFSLRDIYSARFQAEGYTVVTASDGEEALATAVREHPDLIILDVMMPKISGFDVLDILRSTPETKDTKVIMMTALSQDTDRQRGESLGVSKYLVKSQVTLEDVIVAARQALASAPAGTSEVESAAPQPSAPVTGATAAPTTTANDTAQATDQAPANPPAGSTQPTTESSAVPPPGA